MVSFFIFVLLFSGDYNPSCVSALGPDLSGSISGSSLHGLQGHGPESHDQLQQYQQSYHHLHQQQHYPGMTPGGEFCNYGPIYGSSAYSNYVKCRSNPYQRPSTPPTNSSAMPIYYPGKNLKCKLTNWLSFNLWFLNCLFNFFLESKMSKFKVSTVAV